jgi:hypothetical protein
MEFGPVPLLFMSPRKSYPMYLASSARGFVTMERSTLHFEQGNFRDPSVFSTMSARQRWPSLFVVQRVSFAERLGALTIPMSELE